MAAAGVFFSEDQSSPMFVSGALGARELKFRGLQNDVVATRLDDGKIEISIEAAQVEELDHEDARAVKLQAAVTAACGPSLGAAYLGAGTGTYKMYCLVELDTDNLAEVKVDYMHLVGSSFTDPEDTSLLILDCEVS